MRGGELLPLAGSHSSDGIELATPLSPWHYHDMHQLIYAFEGSVEVEGQTGAYKVPRQFAVWIPAGTVHRTTLHKVRSGSVFLDPGMLDSPPGSPRVIAVSTLMREMIMYSMRWPLRRDDDDTSEAYYRCFAKLCVEWIADEVNLVLPFSADRRINAIMSITRNRIAATLPEVCREVGMSDRSLRRHFKGSVGITWEDYRQRLRIYLAIDSLESTTKPVGVIAADVGYGSQAAFAKMFRAVTGVRPAEYRKSRKNNSRGSK